MCLLKMLNYIKVFGLLSIIVNLTQAKSLSHLNEINKNASMKVNRVSGLQQLRIFRQLLKDCENQSSQNTTSARTWQCLKWTSLHLFDDMTGRDIVPVWRGVQFVRENNLPMNLPNELQNEFWKRMDLQHLTWFDRLAVSFARLLSTHRLEINGKELSDAYLQTRGEKDAVGTARHRRHRFNMMVTMMFGVTALGAVLVPMGFQMLSVVSGKALLLAKMALLLASINGLKRVANTGLHYGLYHAPGEHYGGNYDRGDVHHPRNVQIPNTGAQPIEMRL